MPAELDYTCDEEFLKLLTHRSDVDLAVLALELARDAYPDLDFRPTLEWIDRRADELRGPIARCDAESAALRTLSHCLGVEHGLKGDERALCQADGSYLHRVIETRRGIPISLSIVYMAVAQRLGLELQGVSAPLHFITRLDGADGPLFLDPFTPERILSALQCRRWLARLCHVEPQHIQSCLQPANPRTIAARMLNNLKVLYSRREDWKAAWMVQSRLTALEPASYTERRDLALISMKSNRPGSAVDLLQCCLQTCPDDDRDLLQDELHAANLQLARWN